MAPDAGGRATTGAQAEAQPAVSVQHATRIANVPKRGRPTRHRYTVAEAGEPPPASFEDAWPKADRGRNGEIPPQRRSAPRAGDARRSRCRRARAQRAAVAGSKAQPAVTVLKSGVVDGMAYSLYSDGSIEAQMPEGMMRFASIDELTAHIDQPCR